MKDINLSKVTAEGKKNLLFRLEKRKKLRINFTWNCRASEWANERVVSNWGNFSEKKTFIMSNKTFSFMHKFRQQFFNSFQTPTAFSVEWLASLPSLARSIQLIWVKNSKGKFCLFTKVVRAKVTYMVDDDDDEYMRWRKLLCNLRKKSFAQHLKRKFLIYHENSILFIFFSKTFSFQYKFIADAMLWFYNKNQKRH